MSTVELIQGFSRLPSDVEKALNLLLLDWGGNHEGMQLYRLGFAAEDNDTKRRIIPICFSPHQYSYHLLSWEPPTPALAMYENQLKEDTSKGTYNCLLHFVDGAGHPFNPTGFICEKLVPILRKAHEIGLAVMKGDAAVVSRLRAQKIAAVKSRERQAEKAYDSFAESVLNDAKPAFDGNPMSGSSVTSNILLPDLKSAPKPTQPETFDFTLRSRKPVPNE